MYIEFWQMFRNVASPLKSISAAKLRPMSKKPKIKETFNLGLKFLGSTPIITENNHWIISVIIVDRNQRISMTEIERRHNHYERATQNI